MDFLPQEILSIILMSCTKQDIVRLLRVNKKFNNLKHNELIWKNLLEQKYNLHPQTLPQYEKISCFRLFTAHNQAILNHITINIKYKDSYHSKCEAKSLEKDQIILKDIFRSLGVPPALTVRLFDSEFEPIEICNMDIKVSRLL